MGRDRPLRFHVPEPSARPGDEPDFSYLDIPAAGAVRRPEVDVDAAEIRDLASTLVRVLDDEHRAVGPWTPEIDAEELRRGLRGMVTTRIYDERMLTAQRQGKSSFYMGCKGEEAIAVGQANELGPRDMFFPTYRQQGWLIARGWPLVDMMCQVFSNEKDRLHGRQMPIMYSARDVGFFTISGNLGTQYVQAVGWAMASAIKGDDCIASGMIGEGATAEADFHHALTFATTYQVPVDLEHRQQPVGDLVVPGHRRRRRTPRSRPAPSGYGIAALRVDGNDYLAVAGRDPLGARPGHWPTHGPTVIEWVTYRASAHSTSDDPSRYRPKDEWQAWPLGDPIERLERHLIGDRRVVRGAWRRAARRGRPERSRPRRRRRRATARCSTGGWPSAKSIFEDVFEEMPLHLRAPTPGDGELRMIDARMAGGSPLTAMAMNAAVRSAMDVMLDRDGDVVVFGEDVGYFGGVFRCTDGLQAKFGAHRVFDTPIAEGGIIGVAVGMGAYGLRPVVEIQFADYVYPGLDQLISEAARLRYRSGAEFNAPLTVRMPCRRRHPRRSDPQPEPGELLHPRLRAEDGAAVEPVRRQGTADLGHRGQRSGDLPRTQAPLQRSLRWPPRAPRRAVVRPPLGDVPDGHYVVPLGRAAVRRAGSDVTVLAYGTMVYVAEAAAEETGIDAEIIDLRTLLPLDMETIEASVAKTGRCVIAARGDADERVRCRAVGSRAGAMLLRPRGAHRAGHRLGHALPARPGVGLLPRPGPGRRRTRPGDGRLTGGAMADFAFKLPDVGEGVAEAEIVEWKVAVGDVVGEDQPVVDVMTDKATVELPSPVAGTIARLGAEVGEVVRCRLDAGVDRRRPVPARAPTHGRRRRAAAPRKPSAHPRTTATRESRRPPPAGPPTPAPTGATGRPDVAAPRPEHAGPRALAAPAVRQRARTLGIDLATVTGTGPDGRVVHDDLDNLLSHASERSQRRPRRRSGPASGRGSSP